MSSTAAVAASSLRLPISSSMTSTMRASARGLNLAVSMFCRIVVWSTWSSLTESAKSSTSASTEPTFVAPVIVPRVRRPARLFGRAMHPV